MKAWTPWTSLLLAALCASPMAQTTAPSKPNPVPTGAAASAPMKGPAGPGAQGGPGGEHRGPPPEALAACKGLKADAACGFTGPHGAMQGRCWAPPDKPLACKPEHPKGAAPQAPQR